MRVRKLGEGVSESEEQYVVTKLGVCGVVSLKNGALTRSVLCFKSRQHGN